MSSLGLAEAQEIVPDDPRCVYQPVGQDHGLGTRTVVALAQDGLGFIWIGTLNGLFRYDGAEVVEWGEAEGVPNPYITQIEVGPAGRVWVSTLGGIARFDGSRFVAVPLETEQDPASMKRPERQRLAFGRSGDVYVASPVGLAQLDVNDGSLKRMWTKQDGLPEDDVYAAHVAVDGAVWVGGEAGVGRLDPATGAVERVQVCEAAAGDQVKAIMSAADGTLWLRTLNHMLRRDPGKSAFVQDDEGLPGAPGYGLPSLDREGEPLVPTLKGLFYRTAGGWRHVSENNGLISNMVFAALEDHEGAIWIGFGGAGCGRWSGRKQWSAWTAAEGLPDSTAWRSAYDAQGRLWVGTSNGVGIWDPADGRWRTLLDGDGVAGQVVWMLGLGQDERMWTFSARGELTRFDAQTLAPEPIPLPEGFDLKTARMAIGPDRTIWIGNHDRLLTVTLVDGEMRITPVTTPDSVAGCVRDVAAFAGGGFWSGGRNGLARFDGESWTRITTADGLRNDFIEGLATLGPTEVWVHYHDLVGVSQVKLVGGRPVVLHFTAADGLPSDSVYMVGADARGRIWAGGDAGVARIAADGSVMVFDRSDGLIWNDLSGSSFHARPDGSFFLGTSRGLAHYNPAAETSDHPPPGIVIASASLGGERFEDRAEPIVDYDDRDFSVRFSGLTYRNPSGVRFRYRLVGLDTEARQTSVRELRYPNLPWGEYRFEVECCSSAGVWSVAPASFVFTILPPWWGTWWFAAGVVLALVLLLVGVVALRTRKLAADRRRLEEAVAARSAELARANEELQELSFTDVLTGTRNRRYFMAVIGDEIKRVVRRYSRDPVAKRPANQGLVFLLVDIDWFKKVNDQHGHRAGDEVLTEVGRRLLGTIRETDLIVRWGGEEFLIVCRDTEPDRGGEVARRILEAIGGRPFTTSAIDGLSRTCSVGWVPFPWSNGAPDRVSYETVIELADRALYEAKARGRNRAVGVMRKEDAPAEIHHEQLLSSPLADLEDWLVRLISEHGPEVEIGTG